MKRIHTRWPLATIAGGLAATGLSMTAAAASPSYDFVEARYLDTEIDAGPTDVDGDGFSIAGSLELDDSWHLFAGYQDLDFDFGVEFSGFRIGGGYAAPLNDTADVVARVSYIDGEIEAFGFDQDDSGFGVSLGVRGFFTPQAEARAFVNYTDLDESGSNTALSIAGDYYVTPQFAVGPGVEFDDDATTWSVGARFFFGN